MPPPSQARPPTPQTPAEEKFFLQNVNGVSVSDRRFVVPNKTYAMVNVSSVSLERRNPHVTLGWLLIFVGVIGLLGALAGSSLGSGVFGGICFLLGIALRLNTEHVVRLHAAGGESDALVTGNLQFAQQVVQAIERAIVSRG